MFRHTFPIAIAYNHPPAIIPTRHYESPMKSVVLSLFPHCGVAARRPAWGAVCALLVAATLAACGQKETAPAGAPPPGNGAVPARVIQVAPQRVPILLDAVGQVEGSKEVEVRARVSGILLKRLYAEGEVVRGDEPLFRLDAAPYEIAKSQALAQLEQERARNEQARRESARLQKLAAERAVSQKEYDDATSALKLSSASLQATEANLRQAELNLSYTLVTAPVSGITGRVARSEGSLVTAGQESSLLTTISQINPIWVRFSLSESDLDKIPGRRLKRSSRSEIDLTLADGTRYARRGHINFAATQIDPRLATQQLRAEFENPDAQLLPGQFVRVQVTAGARDNVFLVPQTAVIQGEKGYLVFVLEKDGKAGMRPVKTGDWVGTDWMILGGLNAGDRVIVDNLLKLRPGTPVTPLAPAESKPAAPAGAAGK